MVNIRLVQIRTEELVNMTFFHFSFFFPPLLPVDSTGEEPTWNFWKYLVDPNGKVVKAWDSTVSVEEIRPHITELVRKIILKKKDEL